MALIAMTAIPMEELDMDRPTLIPADPLAAAEMAEQEANTETTPRDEKPDPEKPDLAEQNARTAQEQ